MKKNSIRMNIIVGVFAMYNMRTEYNSNVHDLVTTRVFVVVVVYMKTVSVGILFDRNW